MARASSGSRSCSSAVDPLMSANNAVTGLRSPSGRVAVSACSGATRILGIAESGCDAAAPAGCTPLAIAAPQSPQNLEPGAFSAPHFGHRIASPLPHWEQNFLPAALNSAPNAEAD